MLRFTLVIIGLLLVAKSYGLDYRTINTRKGEDAAGEYLVCPVKNGKIYSKIMLKDELKPGLYCLKYDYKSVGLDWKRQFYLSLRFKKKANRLVFVINSPASNWEKNRIIFRVAASDHMTIRLHAGKDSKNLKEIQLKKLSLSPFSYNPGEELFMNQGYFTGCPGGFPAGWFYGYGHVMEPAMCGLSSKYPFEKSKFAMLLGVTEKQKSAILRGTHMPFPKSGTIEFSAWIKDISGDSEGTINLWGDKHHWKVGNKVFPNRKWKKFTVSSPVPKSIKHQDDFWPCITALKGQMAVGRVELKYIKMTSGSSKGYLPEVKACRNLIVNPDFDLGYWGWLDYCKGSKYKVVKYDTAENYIKYSSQPMPEIVTEKDGNKAMKLYFKPSVFSFSFPLDENKKYTVSMYMKSAVKGKKVSGKVMIFSNAENRSHRYKLNDQWKRYQFSFVNKFRSKLQNAYVAFRKFNTPILIDKIQVEAGDLTDFSSQKVQVGLVAEKSPWNMFSYGEANAGLTLKVCCSKNVSGKLNVEAAIKDIWGKRVELRNYKLSADEVISKNFSINTSLRGVFDVSLKVTNEKGNVLGVGTSRYAVCKDLSDIKLKSNPYCAHMYIGGMQMDYMRYIIPLVFKYLPSQQFTRMFFQIQDLSGFSDNPKYLDYFRNYLTTYQKLSRTRIIACGFGNGKLFQPVIDKYPNNRKEVKKYLEYVRKTMIDFKGIIKYWEPINEPHLSRVIHGEPKGDRSMMPELMAKLYKEIKKIAGDVDPEIKIVGPCAGLNEWVDDFLKHGGAHNFELCSYHGYCSDPDFFQMAKKIRQLKKKLNRYGMSKVPIINTEQYFGARLPFLRCSEYEYFRYYFYDKEADCAAMYAKNLIHHASEGVPFACFSFFRNFLRGIRNDYFIFGKFAVVNAAIELLGNAGLGEQLNFDDLLTCFIFPEAKGGILLTMAYDGKADFNLTRDDIVVYDMLGNRISGKTVPLSLYPIYVRFPAKMNKSQVIDFISKISIESSAFPVRCKCRFNSKNELIFALKNRTASALDGELRIVDIPQIPGWKQKALVFQKLTRGKVQTLKFRLPYGILKELNNYNISFVIKTKQGEKLFHERLSVLFASRNRDKSTAKVTNRGLFLGKENLSKYYTNNLSWKGQDDLSAKLAFRWNLSGLYLYIQVKDDVENFPSNVTEMWKHDSIQIYFDVKNDATYLSAKHNKNRTDDTSFTVGILNGNKPVAFVENTTTGRYIGEANQTRGIDPEVKVSFKRLQDHVIAYKIFFPKLVFGDLQLKPGTEIGVSLLINDNDGKGRKAGLTLSPKGTEPYNHEDLYPTLILKN